VNEAIQSFWQERSARERNVIGAGALLLLLALAYAYAWLPIAHERERLLERVPQLRVAVQQTERQTKELEGLRSAVRPTIRDLKTAIEQAAAADGIALVASESAQGAGRVRVAIPSVRASQALAWIARLQTMRGVRMESTRMTVIGESGRVKIEAVFVQAR
jgi:general secretion pathway protein M